MEAVHILNQTFSQTAAVPFWNVAEASWGGLFCKVHTSLLSIIFKNTKRLDF